MQHLITINLYSKSKEEIKNLPISRASRCVLFTEHNEVVLVSYKENNKVFYGIPGGHIEEGESPESACIREVREEAGFVLTQDEIRFIGSVCLVKNENISDSSCYFAHVVSNKQQPLLLTEEEQSEYHSVVIMPFSDAIEMLQKQYLEHGKGATIRTMFLLLQAQSLIQK